MSEKAGDHRLKYVKFKGGHGQLHKIAVDNVGCAPGAERASIKPDRCSQDAVVVRTECNPGILVAMQNVVAYVAKPDSYTYNKCPTCFKGENNDDENDDELLDGLTWGT